MLRPILCDSAFAALRLVAFAVLAVCVTACGSKSQAPAGPRLTTMAAKMRNASITVYPTFIDQGSGHFIADPNEARRLADALTASSNITITMSDEIPKRAVEWADPHRGHATAFARALSAHIHTHSIQTDYALMAAYRIFKPGGVLAIHCMLVDKAGLVVRRIEISPRNAVLREARPRTAADCTDLLIDVIHKRQRLREQTEAEYKQIYRQEHD